MPELMLNSMVCVYHPSSPSFPLPSSVLSPIPSFPAPSPLISPPFFPGISNVEFVCGKAEDVMPTIDLPWAKQGGIIGIVDPPRGGLRKSQSFQWVRHAVNAVTFIHWDFPWWPENRATFQGSRLGVYCIYIYIEGICIKTTPLERTKQVTEGGSGVDFFFINDGCCPADPKVTRIIRESPAIQKLIYVSCNPSGAKRNIIE